MANKIFAAIDVGSNELSMKIYEITPKKGAKEIDYVNSTVELGSDTYNSGKITEKSTVKVCEILNRFRRKMKEYDVRDYKAYASSAVREAENSVMVLERIKQHTYSCDIIQNDENKVVINVSLSLGAHSSPPVIKMNALWSFFCDGTLTVSCSGKTRENAPLLPHLGLKLIMPKEFENVEYFGLGDKESYPDRNKAFRYSLYKTTATEMYEHYIRPQECSNRFGVRYASVENDAGIGIEFSAINEIPFCFKAIHYDANDLIESKHDFELPETDKTVLNIDWKVNAVSENSELDVPKNSRNLGDKSFDFGFKIVPYQK